MPAAAVLLMKAVMRWRELHGAKLPSNAKDKAAFADIVKSMQQPSGPTASQVTTGALMAATVHALLAVTGSAPGSELLVLAQMVWTPYFIQLQVPAIAEGLAEEPGHHVQEENFKEALENARKVFVTASIRAKALSLCYKTCLSCCHCNCPAH